MKFWGYVVVSMFAFICSIPPVIGYGITTLFSGFVFGFPLGFLPVFFGSLLGASFVFILGRSMELSYIKNAISSQRHLYAFTKLIENRGVKFLVLFRLAPYPFNVTNLFLSTTKVSFYTFFVATALALPRLLIHIYVGSQALSIAELIGYKSNSTETDKNSSPQNKVSFVKIFPVVFTSSLAIIVFIYTFYLVKKELKKQEKIDQSEQLILDQI
ncbi:Golgi apparatus membrane protein tvp38 [Smittium culicis]|uniref:Golgi apparatus membrane protein TVP38 n=1 Tax=Smittium culicis TaxID=133412 RepID=A0A1R1XA30_9FUNG|nr:Golgi apparatus membrane protein tvp38 [Smittium culicis]OMJ25043.1 Golgi apparatus membrane protein tvp38 [Smittium culicis]